MSEWLQIKSVEMLVSKSELQLETNNELDSLSLSCDLLNIARGRCEILLFNYKSSEKNYLSISADKPIMNAKINLNNNKFNTILNTINNFSLNKSKKIKVVLYLNKSLAVNNDGFLSVDKDIDLEVVNIKLLLPLI